MPWLAVPCGDLSRLKAIRKAFNISKVPKLLVLDQDGLTVCRKGTEAILLDPDGDRFPWDEPLSASCCCV